MSQPQPPGTTGRIEAASALVVAPHPDDEVVGCGGLLAQLSAAGTAVDVLFVTDGGACAPPGVEAADFGARRRREAAAAAAVLGLRATLFLGLPDGQIAHRVDALAAALKRELVARTPELLLVPSPLEISADHVATFAALHRLLAPLRRADDALTVVAARLRILAYEVNRPLYPDLLIDIGEQLPDLEAAMACHASQQEQHDYLAAAIGLARYRALSLPPTVTAAEAYRQLTLDDFTRRSPSQLIEHLGGRPELAPVVDGPLVSVIVRTRDRPRLLAEALASIAASSYRRVEVVLVNDGGSPVEPPAEFPLPVVRVDLDGDGRAAAAQAGVEAASGEYITFLDDDDRIAPEHFAVLVGLVSAADVRVAYTDAAVSVHELDPAVGWREVERRLPYSRDFDPDLLALDNYIPLNTLIIERALCAAAGPFDETLPFFEDWDFLLRLARLTPFHHLPRVTCEYRHFRGGGHHVLGETPRRREDFLSMKARVMAQHAAADASEKVARAVDTLRRELVEEAEARRRAEVELPPLRGRRFALEGEVASLSEAAERQRRALAERAEEITRLHEEEARLHTQLGETYAEIERQKAAVTRLEELIEEMKSTRAWRGHEWWERHKPGS